MKIEIGDMIEFWTGGSGTVDKIIKDDIRIKTISGGYVWFHRQAIGSVKSINGIILKD